MATNFIYFTVYMLLVYLSAKKHSFTDHFVILLNAVQYLMLLMYHLVQAMSALTQYVLSLRH